MNDYTKNKLRDFLLQSFVVDPILVLSFYTLWRFGEQMWSSEHTVVALIFICSLIMKFFIWVGMLIWRQELNE